MLAKVHTAAVVGLEGAIVEVEVDTSRGLPSFVIVGLPDAAVQESRERVQAAVKNAGLEFPRHRLTVNLAPASLRKEGPAYDLPIALGALAATGQIRPGCLDRTLALGELSLDGAGRHVRAGRGGCGGWGGSGSAPPPPGSTLSGGLSRASRPRPPRARTQPPISREP